MELSFFAEMAWKSALIAGAALGLAFALRSRAAADRAQVLRIGVAMLLLLPLIAVALPALKIEALPAPPPVTAAQAAAAAAAPALTAADILAPVAATDLSAVSAPRAALSGLSGAGPQPAAPTIWDDPTPLVLLAYLGGLLMVGGRLLAGLFMLRLWTRDAREIQCPEWLDAFERARWDAANGGRLRLLVSDTVPSPLSWGWRNPVILIDPDTLAEPEEADAILAHEVAHVARSDWAALMLTRIAATLFWFNPLVWLLEREIVQQAEEAADCEAARCVEPTRYAQTLLSWAQVGGHTLPANSIAPKDSALGRRVKAILDGRLRERASGTALARFAVMLCVVIAAPVAAMKLVQAAAPAAPEAPAAPQAPDAPQVPPAPHAPRAPMAPGAPAAPHAADDMIVEIPDVTPIVNEALAAVLPQIPEIVASALSATAAVDSAEIQRATDEALRDADVEIRRMSPRDRERMNREIRRAVEQARRAAADARRQGARARVEVMRVQPQIREAMRVHARVAPQIAIAMRDAQRAAAIAPRMVAVSMAGAAEGMARGAEGMERGARGMEEHAARLRDPAFRQQAIARARARGETVTDSDLIEAADGLAEGAQGMREGAREMRESAERMRAGRHD